MNDVIKFLRLLDNKIFGYVIVGVSYGPDSMALLNILSKNLKNVKIICAHVHHNHRKESDSEALELKKYCDTNSITFEMLKIDEYKKNSFSEEEAREKRYDFFRTLANKYKTKYIFTAHHGDDLVETVLMRLVRGSTLKGYMAIRLVSKQDDFIFIRPLLYVTKDDLLNYCQDNHLPYATDITNESDNHTRNRYRKYVLPFLKKENPMVHRQFLMFSDVLSEYDRYVCGNVKQIYKSLLKDDRISLKSLMEHDPLIVKQVLYKYIKQFTNVREDKISFALINNVYSFLCNKKTTGRISLPAHYDLIKDYDSLYILRRKDKTYDYCYELLDSVVLPDGSTIKKVDTLSDTSNYCSAFSSEDLKMPLFVRNKRKADRMMVLGLNKNKKIKDIFINEKVSRQKRDSYPVVTDSTGKIIWVPGVKKSKYDRSKQGKYDIILKYLKEGKNDCTK